jgi:hypothetical protein
LFSDKSLFRISRGRPGVGHRLQEQSLQHAFYIFLPLMALSWTSLHRYVNKWSCVS